jgi:hypothetical protein
MCIENLWKPAKNYVKIIEIIENKNYSKKLYSKPL